MPLVGPGLRRLRDAVIPGAQSEQAGGRQQRRIVHAVAGQLRHQETIIRHVLVKRLHHPVAIAPGVGVRNHRRAAEIVFTIARDVEPVAAPMLAEMRRREEPGDQPGQPVGVVICESRGELRLVGRQADQVEVHAPDQGALIRAGVLRQALGPRGCRNQAINRLARLIPAQRTKGPVAGGVAPWCAFVDPMLECCHLFRAQRPRREALVSRPAALALQLGTAGSSQRRPARWRRPTCHRARSHRANPAAARP